MVIIETGRPILRSFREEDAADLVPCLRAPTNPACSRSSSQTWLWNLDPQFGGEGHAFTAASALRDHLDPGKGLSPT